MAETQQDILDDIHNIAEALCQWFKGQEIPPGRGISAMCTLIATMCAVESDPREALRKASVACDAIEGLTLTGLLRKREG